MATPNEIRRWVAETAVDWYGKCAGLTWQTIHYNGGISGAPYGSATAAYKAARIVSKNPAIAPPGAIHYWSYYGTDYRGQKGDWGHVALDIYGGGTDVLSATKNAHDYWGTHAGLISVSSQSSRAGMRYLGWAHTYGANQRIAIATPTQTGDGSRPFNPEEDDMTIFTDRHAEQLEAIYSGIFGPANVGAPQMTWANPFGEEPGVAYYGLLPISIRNQVLIGQQAAQIAALGEALRQLSGGGIDLGAVQAAAQQGALSALAQFPTAQQIADAVNDADAARMQT